MARKTLDFPELEGRREGAAMLAFREDYTGDRVLALMAGLLMMVYSAFEDKDDFYILDDLNEQNCTTVRATSRSRCGSCPPRNIRMGR